MSKSQLSEKVRELIQKARIMHFADWRETHSAEAIRQFQLADDQGRYLTDEDLQIIQQNSPSDLALLPVVQQLRDRASDIVGEAKSEVLNAFPSITQPGGGLYPPERSDSCWRDLWNFLRCITYGVTGQRTDYTSAEGMHFLHLLYQELHVPLDAMILGLEGVKTASLQRVEPQQQTLLAPYFDHLIEQLRAF